MALAHLNDAKSQLPVGIVLAHLNDATSLDGCLEIFLLTCRVNNLSPKTIADYSQKVGRFLDFCQTQDIKTASQITSTHVKLFLLERQQHCKPVSVHDYYGCIARFFNWLLEENMLDKSPMAHLHPPKVPKQVIQPFTLEDIQKMLTLISFDISSHPKALLAYRNYAIVLTFLDTGLRLAELAAIQLTDIDFDSGIIKVMGKGQKERFVRMGKETQKAMLKYLLQRKDNLPCLWLTEEGKPLKAAGIQIMIRRLGKRVGLTGVRCSPHTFRHSFAIFALRNGMGEFNLQWLLGHSTLHQTRRYCSSLGVNEAMIAHEKASPVDNLRLH